MKATRMAGHHVWMVPANRVASGSRASIAVHDHIRLDQDEIVAIARISLGIGTWNVQHTSMTEGG